MKNKKVALFCSWIKSKGGVEKEIIELLEHSKYDIDVYTWAYDPENSFDELNKYNINVIGPKSALKLSHAFLSRGLFLFISLFSKIPLKDYDKFIVITSGVAEFILFRNHKPKNNYVLVNTPLREASNSIYSWNLKNRDWGIFKRGTYKLAVGFYNLFERLAWKRFDFTMYNSKFVQKRAHEKNLPRSPVEKVVYPFFPNSISKSIYSKHKNEKLENEKYFLYVSRLNPPKRQDVLIRAWKKFSKYNPDYKLYIAGNPESQDYMKKLERTSKSDKSIKIMTGLNNKRINELFSNCFAGIFIPFEEDFGIVPLEVVSAGKPLICINEGGFKELLKGYSQVYYVQEKGTVNELEKEVLDVLERFMVEKKDKGKNNKSIKYDFVKEFDKVLSLEQ